MTIRSSTTVAALTLGLCAALTSPVGAQSVLFDFDSAPNHTSLPIDLSAGGVAAHLSATGAGFSVQDTTAPVVPLGFTGRFLYPNSVFAADLQVDFTPALSAFSIRYAPQELACDDTATMRVSAYSGGVLVGSATATVPQPGTWPVGILSCSFAQGFDRVVVHYDQRPPTCSDWGPIFCADDMRVTPLANAWTNLGHGLAGLNGIPQLNASGTLAPGSAGSLVITNGRAGAPTWLLFSFQSRPQPFRGGTLVPFPIELRFRLNIDTLGTASLPYLTPTTLPSGTRLYVQAVLIDTSAVQGFAMTPALQGVTP